MKNLLLLLFLAIAMDLHSQVAINNTNESPDNTAMLDVKSSSKGLLVPRMSLFQRLNIANPANGLLVYQTGYNPGFYYNSGTPASPAWLMLGYPGLGWQTTGNSGTDTATNFIGTIDDISLRFKINSQTAGKIEHGKRVFGKVELGKAALGQTAPGKAVLGKAALGKTEFGKMARG